jgi:hypothetical protein
MNFDPEVFGEGFHRFVQMEVDLFGVPLGAFFHVATIVILFLVFTKGNKYRRLFAVYFGVNWIFLFGYWGVYAIIYWTRTGLPYIACYAITPVLLGFIVFHWIKEILNPEINLDFKKVKAARFIILAVLLWGFWYPGYKYGEGFIFSIKDIILSNYGLMPCPTTMVVLSLMTLKYPDTNRSLYLLFTVYALFIGTATVLSGWIPDIPFIILGLYALSLILFNKNSGAVLKNKIKPSSSAMF